MLKKVLYVFIISIFIIIFSSCNNDSNYYIKINAIATHIADTTIDKIGLRDEYSNIDYTTLNNIIYLKLISMPILTDEEVENMTNSIINTMNILSLKSPYLINSITTILLSSKENPKEISERIEKLINFYESKSVKLGKEGYISILTGLSLCNEWDYDEVIESLNQVLCYTKTHRKTPIPDRILAYIMSELAKTGPGNVCARMIVTEIYENNYLDYFPKDEKGYPKDWVEPNTDTDGDGENDSFDWDDAVDVYEDDIEEEDMEEDSEDLDEEEEESQTPDQIDDVIIEEVDGDGD